MLTYGGKITHFGAIVFEQHHGPRWHGDQGHFIMACPAATWLSTGMSDEGECGHLRRQESRLQRGLIKISLDQECKQQRKVKKKEKKMILHFVPSVPPLPTSPSRSFGVLTNRPALSPVSALHSAREPQWQSRGTSATATSSHRCAATPRGVSTASRLFSQVPVNPVSPMNWSAVEAGELTSIRVTHPMQRWCLRVQFILSCRMEAGDTKRNKVFWLNLCLKKVHFVWVRSKSCKVTAMYRSRSPTWLDHIFQHPAH